MDGNGNGNTEEAGRELTRRRCLGLLAQSALALPVLTAPGHAEIPRSYRDLLDRAITAMEKGEHSAALSPLKEALQQDRTEIAGLLTLGTLYLHTGSPTRAHHEFARVRRVFPGDPLAIWGQRLAAIGRNEKVNLPKNGVIEGPVGSSDGFEDEIPESAALLLQEYLLLMNGKPDLVQNATAAVTIEEKNLLRLEIAGMAALQSGDTVRGIALLRALIARPEMRPLAEDRAFLLSFLPTAPTQPGAPTLPNAILLPEPPTTTTVSGLVRLAPPHPLPDAIAFVSYEVRGGGGYTATTNYAPFIAEWNSTRFPNGLYTIRAVAYDATGRELKAAEHAVTVSNQTAPLSRSLTTEDRRLLRDRLLHLLTPRPTRKAAHFALAEWAAKRGEEEEALRHIEAVVAIDPLYRNARESLKQYNRAVIGRCAPIWCGVMEEKYVALTFDDGPHPTLTPPLLDALRDADALATFFIVGIRAEASPDLIRRMAKEGHELANHSYSHPNLTFLPRTGIERELCRTSCIIRETIGVRPRFYRPPGGNVNQQVSEVAETLGMSGAFWTLDGLQYERPPFSPRQLTKYVLDRVRPGAIILLHNAPANTVAAIPAMVRGLKQKGYSLVTMSELARRSRPTASPILPIKPPKLKE